MTRNIVNCLDTNGSDFFHDGINNYTEKVCKFNLTVKAVPIHVQLPDLSCPNNFRIIGCDGLYKNTFKVCATLI